MRGPEDLASYLSAQWAVRMSGQVMAGRPKLGVRPRMWQVSHPTMRLEMVYKAIEMVTAV